MVYTEADMVMVPPTDRELAFRGVTVSDKWKGNVRGKETHKKVDEVQDEHSSKHEQPEGEDDDPAIVDQKNTVDG